jgi:hypothetical protein
MIIEHAAAPEMWTEQWVELYGHLIARHGIEEISAFSPSSLARQLVVPGVYAFRHGRAQRLSGWFYGTSAGRSVTNTLAYESVQLYVILGRRNSRGSSDLGKIRMGAIQTRGSTGEAI